MDHDVKSFIHIIDGYIVFGWGTRRDAVSYLLKSLNKTIREMQQKRARIMNQ